MNSIFVNIVNKSHHPLPRYQTIGSAGMDLTAFISSPMRIKPLERKIVSTGIYLELPTGIEAQIRGRSGLAFRNGVTVLNSPGTIDSDYRGEIKVILINLSNELFKIEDGDRIAQMVIASYNQVSWESSSLLAKSIRGDGGFGSTGK